MPSPGCLSDADLRGLRTGTLADDRLAAAAAHLDGCDTCRAAADSSYVQDPLDVALRGLGQTASFGDEAGLALARQKLAGLVTTAPGLGGVAANVGDRVGEFVLVREIGRGGMGVVFEAEQVGLGRRVAVKVLPRRGPADGDAARRFAREAKAVARLHHTNIVPVFVVGEEAGVPYYAMQLIRGRGLNELVAAMRGVPPSDRWKPAGGAADGSGVGPAPAPHTDPWRRAAELIRQVADALAYAHGQGVLHRDVKPSNLLIDARGTAWVTDFGLAKSSADADLTQTGDILGTPRYMPPEAFDGKTDERSDVYSLGLTLFELLALQPAFSETDRGRLIKQVMTTSPPPLRAVCPGVPRDLETITSRACDRDPRRRYPTARAFADDLRRFLNDEPILARRPTAVETLARWARHNRGLAAALGVLFVVLVGVTAASVVAADRFRRMADDKTRLANRERDARTTADEALAAANAARDAARRDLYHAETSLMLRAAEASGGPARLAEHVARWAPAPGETDLRGWEWRLARRMAKPVGKAFDTPYRAAGVAHSPDGKTLLVGGGDGLDLLDADTGTVKAEWAVGREVDWPVWDPRGTRVFAGLSGGQVKMIEAASGRVTWERPALNQPSPSWHPAGRWVAYRDGPQSCRVADAATGASVQVLAGVEGPCAFSPDGRRFAGIVRSTDGLFFAVRVWDAESWAVVNSATVTNLRVLAASWSPDGKYFAAATAIGDVILFDAAAGTTARKLDANGKIAHAVAWQPDGSRLAVSDETGSVRVWETDTWDEVPLCRGATSPIYTLSWRAGGGELAGGANDNVLRVWAMNDLPAERRFWLGGKVPNVAYLSCAWHPDGSRLAASSGNYGTNVWRTDGRRAGLVQGVLWEWSADGAYSANCYRESIEVRDAAGKTVASVELRGQPKWLAWRPGTRTLAVRVATRLFLWDPLGGGKPELVFGEPNAAGVIDFEPGGGLAWDPAGSRLAFAPRSGKEWPVRVFDPVARRVLLTLPARGDTVRCVAWSPDGKRLAVAGDEPTVRVYDPETGAEVQKFVGHGAAVFAVAWSPDGTRIATGGADGTVKVWDPATGRAVVTFDAGAVVRHAAWTRDGSALAAALENGYARVWNAGRTSD